MQYDDQNRLTNIVDALGLSSALAYNEHGVITELATPYGATSFFHDPPNESGQTNGLRHISSRRILAADAQGGTNLYWFQMATTVLPETIGSSEVPVSTPYGTLDTATARVRNSFHWNPRQAQALPSDLTSLDSEHYQVARVQHWLAGVNEETVSETLSWVREASPDAITPGTIRFYDYPGKTNAANVGTQSLARVVARRLPTSETQYAWSRVNRAGLMTNLVDTWRQPDGQMGARSNVMEYAGWTTTNLLYVNGILTLTNTFVVENLPSRQVDAAGVTQWSLGDYSVSWVTNNYPLTPTKSNTVVTATRRPWPQTATNALDETMQWWFNATNQLLGWRSVPGLVVTNLFDSPGFLTNQTILYIGATNTWTYSNGLVVIRTDPLGLSTTNTWDALNRLTSTYFPDGTYTSNRYDRLDLAATRDRLDHWTHFGYDALRRLTAVTNANQVITRLDWCGCGSLDSVTEAWNTPAQFITTFGYDLQGNRTRIFHPDATVTNWFDALGRLSATSDGQGYRAFLYNNQGLVTNVYNALGAEQAVVYDILDRPIRVTDANGVTVTNTFDALGRLLTRTWPDGGVEHFGYSARGLVAYTNQSGEITRFAYDAARRLVAVTNANHEVVRYTNDAAGNLLSLTDGKNQTTRWNYDRYGRVTNQLDQTGVEVLRYTYDAQGRLASRWSKAKGTTYYTNDAVGNLTRINYPASPDVTLAYDPLNRLTNLVDAVGTTRFTYAAGGQLATEDGPWNNDTITYGYLNRLRASLSLQQPVGVWTNGFRYDAAWRLTNVTSRAGAFDYLHAYASPLPLRVSLPNTSYITNTYDPVGRLLGTVLKKSDHATLNKHEYTYNAGHQRTRQTFTDNSTYDYTYDGLGQLKLADSSVNAYDRGYAYDAAWNLAWRTNGGTVEAFTVDSRNQLTGTPAFSATYDDNGNLRIANYGAGGFVLYSYDDENQLTEVYYEGPNAGCGGGESLAARSSRTRASRAGEAGLALDGGGEDFYPVWMSQFTYDGLGRQRVRREYQWNCDFGQWEELGSVHYVYDARRVVQERDGNNAPYVSYTRGNDLSGRLEGAGGIGGLLGRSHGYSAGTGNWSTHNFYHADGGGNITYLVNSSQGLGASYRYDPYGNLISYAGGLASGNTYRFSSKEQHANSGLYYYGFRFYDTGLQRWLNRDPLGEAGGINLYGFVGNRPINEVDPYGLYVLDEDGFPVFGTGTAMDSYLWDHELAAEIRAEEQKVADEFLEVGKGLAEEAVTCFLPPLKLAKPARAVARAAGSGGTTLYRAVSHAEYADITANGVLRPGPNSYATGKFFAETGQHASQWGNALEGVGNSRVIEAQFPSSTANQFMRWQNLDNIGPARFGTFEQLGQPTIRLWPGSP